MESAPDPRLPGRESIFKMEDEGTKIEAGVNWNQNKKAMEDETQGVEVKKGTKRKLTKEDRKRIAKEKKAKLTERKKPPGFDKEFLEETTFFRQNGLRYVKPYYFTFTTYCKGRWLNRELLDIFREEFRSETVDYYERAINYGKITVNGEKATPKTVLKDNDVIRNLVHRHEPPVTDQPLEFVENNDEVVVLNKPSSIPVHPCGRYRHNTVVFLLGKEHNLKNLYTIHRIDRLTSGILMFARSLKKARELEAQVREREVHKEYICKVFGDFPSEPVDCEQPIMVVSHKVGVCRVSSEGKPCRTVFTKIHGNGKTCVIKCTPYTGRMHQIRVHLQWLGYPIVNDPIYNHPAWGPNRGRGGVSDDQALEVIKAIAESSLTHAVPKDAATRNIPANTAMESSSSQGETMDSTIGKASDSIKENNERFDGQNLEIDCQDSSVPELNTPKGELEEHPNISNNCYHGNKETGNHCYGNSCKSTDQDKEANCLEDSETRKDVASDNSTCGTKDIFSMGGSDGENFTMGSSDGEKFDPDCSECQIVRRDPTPKELIMYLHALSYKGPDWEYCTPMPSWALQDTDTIPVPQELPGNR